MNLKGKAEPNSTLHGKINRIDIAAIENLLSEVKMRFEQEIEKVELAIDEARGYAVEEIAKVKDSVEEGGYIESLKELNKGGKLTFWVGTQAEYEALETKSGNCFYIITDDTSSEDINTAIQTLSEEIASNKIDNYFIYDTYIEKFPNGTLKALAKYTFTNTITAQYGNVYYSSIIQDTIARVFFPSGADFKLSEVFNITASIGKTNEMLGVNIASYNSDTINFYVFSHKEQSAAVTAEITFELTGKWENKGV